MDAGKNTYCNPCSYVNWDVWAKVLPDGDPITSATAQAKLVPYVYGTITPIADIPSSISATYTGATLISTNIAGALTSQPGTFNANINLNGG